jgi:hypothetical protein
MIKERGEGPPHPEIASEEVQEPRNDVHRVKHGMTGKGEGGGGEGEGME